MRRAARSLLCRGDEVKIGDFGQARETRSRPPYTDYISTRWYRAPELLLRAKYYNSPVDVWACGVLMVELYNRAPLFPGNSEVHQMYMICETLGSPSERSWPEGMKLATAAGFKFPSCEKKRWAEMVPSASREALHLISEMLQFDSNKRITAAQALSHPFFAALPSFGADGFTSDDKAALIRAGSAGSTGSGGLGSHGRRSSESAAPSSGGATPVAPDSGSSGGGAPRTPPGRASLSLSSARVAGAGAGAGAGSGAPSVVPRYSMMDDAPLTPAAASPAVASDSPFATVGDAGSGKAAESETKKRAPLQSQSSLDASMLEDLLASLERDKLS